MYQLEMYYTVKTLLSQGKSQRAISRELGISRKTVKKIYDKIHKGELIIEEQQREKKLAAYQQEILDCYKQGLTSRLIYERLKATHGIEASYPTVNRYVRQFKNTEVYVPVISSPGKQAQVDFGYLGYFHLEEKKIKVWVFSMILSHSRYAYYQVVTEQSIRTFINCHIHAFEYFGGVPQTVLIDNLKSGVIHPNFYEPVLQHQYAEFLSHYNSAPLTARVRRGQDKGKVESGIKYVKNNFLKGLLHRNFKQLEKELRLWNDQVCNQRLHGTTRQVPSQVYEQTEKQALQSLPARRYEIYQIEERKVNTYGHISYRYNFYSVPSKYVGKQVIIKDNGHILKIYYQFNELCSHPIHQGQGAFITQQGHRPEEKQYKDEAWYQEQASQIGHHVIEFLKELQKHKPHHWYRLIKGVFALRKRFSEQQINLACLRALNYGNYSYRAVRNICEQGLYEQEVPTYQLSHTGDSRHCGFNHDLSMYDKLNYQLKNK